MFEFQLADTRWAQHVILRVDCGEGFDPALAVSLPVMRGKVSKRICYFPAQVCAVQLEVIAGREATAGELPLVPDLAVAHCCLAWLAPYFAQDRLCQRLINMHRKFRGFSSRRVRSALKQEAASKRQSWRSVALRRYGETFHKRCPVTGYTEWLAQVEPGAMPDSGELVAFLADQRAPVEFVMRLRITPQNVAGALPAVRSIQAQTYPNWRLIVEIASELETATHPVVASINTLAGEDSRLRVVSGDIPQLYADQRTTVTRYFSELPASGRLSVHALYFAAESVMRQPDCRIVYSDSDHLNSVGGRESPLFKPGWNPDLLLAYNYVGQWCFFRWDLLQQLGCEFPAGENVTNYDSLLRCRDTVPAEVISHIPQVLYHQKQLPDSEQQQLNDAERRCLTSYLQSLSGGNVPVLQEAWQSPSLPGAAITRCRWPLPQPAPLVSLLIPTRDGVDILRQCVSSILEKTRYPNYEVLILDNQSRCADTLAYFAAVQKDKRVQVHRWNHPFNYSAINNFGATLARGSILGLVNNDIEVITPDWLCEMVSHTCRAEIGCVGAKLYYGNDTVQHGGVILGIGGTAGHSHKYVLRDAAGYMARLQVVQNLSAVTGACLLLRKSVFEEVGGLNEKNLAVAYNDVDLCLKVREAGYRNLWTPFAELYHHESVSRGADDTAAKRRRAEREAQYMRQRWGEQLDNDPAYNPNLTLIHEDFSLA